MRVLTSILSVLAFTAVLTSGAPLKKGGSSAAKVYSKCSVPGTFALTFDDGPYEFSWELAETLKKNGIQATWFVNGKNWVDVENDSVATSAGTKTYLEVLKHIYDLGHQVSSHTYEHKTLPGLSREEVRYQMTRNEDVIRKAIGKRPTYMRPPEGSYDNVLDILGELGYKVIIWDLDSNDWKTHNLASEQAEYKSVLDSSNARQEGHIALNHEVYDQTVHELVPWATNYVKTKGYRFVTVAECLGFSKGSAYAN